MATLTGGISAGSTLGGRLPKVTPLTGGASAGATLGGSMPKAWHPFLRSGATPGGSITAHFLLTGRIRKGAALGGELNVTTPPETTYEGRRTALGRLPVTPLLVYAVDIQAFADIATTNVPDNGSFLMSAVYVPETGDGLKEYGARASSVGTKVVRAGRPTAYRFRYPEPCEVVWAVQANASGATTSDLGLYRFDDEVWKPYQSVPERALLAQQAYLHLDPDGALMHYARLMGAVFSQIQRDGNQLAKVLSADHCPAHCLGLLAKQHGIVLDDPDDTVAAQRRRVRYANEVARKNGTTFAVEQILRTLGYQGHVSEVWIDPDASTWTTYANAPAAIQTDIDNRDLADGITATSGAKGEAFILVPHGYYKDPPGAEVDMLGLYDLTLEELLELTLDELYYLLIGGVLNESYWPTPAIAVHLRAKDGTDLPLNLPPATWKALTERVSRNLFRYALPAHLWIRLFVFDQTISDANDSLTIEDTLTITEIP